MYRYVLRRLLLMIPVVLGVSFIIFSIMFFIPGNPAAMLLSSDATQEELDQLNHELGLDQPFFTRYFNYIINALKGDFGKSYQNRQPVGAEIGKKFPVSLKLATGSIIVSLIIGVPIGVLSAVKQYSLADKIPTSIALFVAAMPAFIIGMILMLVFGLKLKLLPVSGVKNGLKSFILPWISLGLPNGARQLRFTRSSMLETIRQDYVRTAKAKGAAPKKVIWGHAMKNALMPVITVAGTSFGGMLGGAVATESLFGLPGLGAYISEGIKFKDTPAVMGGIIIFATLFSLIMLLVDISYAFVDPRIKAKYSGRR